MDSTQDPLGGPDPFDGSPPLRALDPADPGGLDPQDPLPDEIAALALLDPAEAAGPAAEIADRLSRALDAEGDGR
jgi:hypothetical protein